jgi:oligoendopeptidase F
MLSLTSCQWREAKEGVLQRSHFYIWHYYSVNYLTGSMLALMEEYEFSVIKD